MSLRSSDPCVRAVWECVLGVDQVCAAMPISHIRKNRTLCQRQQWLSSGQKALSPNGRHREPWCLVAVEKKWIESKIKENEHSGTSLAVSARPPCTRLYKSSFCLVQWAERDGPIVLMWVCVTVREVVLHCTHICLSMRTDTRTQYVPTHPSVAYKSFYLTC